MGFLSYHSNGLMLSMLLGQILSFGLLFFQTIKEDKIYIRHLSFSTIKNSFKVHQDFPKYNMPQGFLDGFRESSIVLIISNYFGPVVLGSYSFAMNIINKPFLLIGNSFQQVFFQKINIYKDNKKKIMDITKSSIIGLTLISLPPLLIGVFFIKEIFNFIFSDKWHQAGILSQLLILWIVLRFIVSSISSIPFVLNRLKTNFFYSFFYNVFPPLVLLLSAKYIDSYYSSFILFTISNLNVIAFTFYWYLKICKEEA